MSANEHELFAAKTHLDSIMKKNRGPKPTVSIEDGSLIISQAIFLKASGQKTVNPLARAVATDKDAAISMFCSHLRQSGSLDALLGSEPTDVILSSQRRSRLTGQLLELKCVISDMQQISAIACESSCVTAEQYTRFLMKKREVDYPGDDGAIETFYEDSIDVSDSKQSCSTLQAKTRCGGGMVELCSTIDYQNNCFHLQTECLDEESYDRLLEMNIALEILWKVGLGPEYKRDGNNDVVHYKIPLDSLTAAYEKAYPARVLKSVHAFFQKMPDVADTNPLKAMPTEVVDHIASYLKV